VGGPLLRVIEDTLESLLEGVKKVAKDPPLRDREGRGMGSGRSKLLSPLKGS